MNIIHLIFAHNDPDQKIEKILLGNTPMRNLAYMTTAPFYTYADRFFDDLYREINDEYELIVEGAAFEYYFLRDLAVSDANCRRVTWKNTAPPPLKRANKLLYYDTTAHAFPAEAFEATTAEQALLLLVKDTELSSVEAQLLYRSGTRFVMYQGHTCRLTCRRGGSCRFIWEFDDLKTFKEIAQAMYYRFLPPYVGNHPLPPPQSPTVVEVTDFAPLELGKAVTPQYRLVSGSGTIPPIRMVSGDPSVVQIDQQGRICAIGEGNTTVSFYLPNEATCFCRKAISVYDPRYAKKLSLTVSEQTVCVGTVFRVEHTVEPAQASDAHRISFKCQPDHLLKHLGGNHFEATTAGTVTIRAQAFGGASAVVTVKIYAAPSHIAVHIPDQNSLYVNDDRVITAHIQPANARRSEINFESSDETVATVEKRQGGDYVLHAKGMGRCLLTFASADDPSLKCEIPIEVKSMMYSDKIHPLLYVGIALAVLSCFIIGQGLLLVGILHLLAQGCIGFFAIKLKRQEKFPSVYGAGKIPPGVKNTVITAGILLVWSVLLLFWT